MTRPTTAQLNAAYDQFNFWYDKAKKLDEDLAKAEERIAELESSHTKLRESMAAIHNTIRLDGAGTSLATILNAAKRAYEESASAAGIKLDVQPAQPCEHSMFWDASGVKRCSKCDMPEHANVHYSDAAEMEIAALRQRIAELEESHAQVIQSRGHYKRMTGEGLKQLAESRTVKLPPELSTIGELIRTQDNRITDQPMFVVFQKREIIGSDEHSPSRICWVWDGEEVSELRAKRLEALYQDGRDTRGYDRYAMQEVDEFVTACFTEHGCKDFLRQNGHNLRQPYIYACGSFRNNEYQLVRNWLAGIKVEAE